ncbi:ATP phosphoribosyltransferase regulatory subunit [Thermoflavimicrobium dichotomicum]|uniref:ATP phosphoribosyltransferase regulatory subunit n=1 Tax=Thermoflavimicrobium dichotomicum TaxID=46223 RepID=A0A1I3JU27_9BACL|nr:ATP phosphoribosyltransferase regulatory subunit [Thermoflavimicrobium dichotomicum]SFI63455.1 ATP phosphoribosyltransferase regulatory subunit [Thermoflavimicrobium dichotomicum]
MSKLRGFEKPTGFHDMPPELARKKRILEERVRNQFERWGYEEVLTPTLEFYDTVGKASAILKEKMFKCMDQQGNTLILRPDQTAPIARMVASVLKKKPLPLRLSYHSNVFRAQENEAGRHAEFYQSGVELIGLPNTEADAEVIALAIEALQACYLESFQLAIGHVTLLDGFIRERIKDDSAVLRLKEYLGQRNMVGFHQELDLLGVSERTKKELAILLRISPGKEQLLHIRKLTHSPQVQQAIEQLEEIWNHLDGYGVTSSIVFDFSLIGQIHYYTGMYFEGYSTNLGFPLLSGGRYDQLLSCFDRPLPATGFALDINRVMEASPFTGDSPKRFIIGYKPLYHRQAIKKAISLRKEGNVVILHRLDDAFSYKEWVTEQDRVILLTGEGEERYDVNDCDAERKNL